MSATTGKAFYNVSGQRCKQATGSHDKILGGKSMILIGDPAQLPTVADKPLYHSKPSSDVREEGYQVY